MWLRRMLKKKIEIRRQPLGLAYAEWDLREGSGPGWDCVARFIADLEAARDRYRLTVYPYSRGRYALRANPRDWGYYKNVYGRHLLCIQLRRDNAALRALLAHYEPAGSGIVVDNYQCPPFIDPIEIEPGLTIAADETILVTGHDCDWIYLLRAAEAR
jgi:hypothetical protein